MTSMFIGNGVGRVCHWDDLRSIAVMNDVIIVQYYDEKNNYMTRRLKFDSNERAMKWTQECQDDYEQLPSTGRLKNSIVIYRSTKIIKRKPIRFCQVCCKQITNDTYKVVFPHKIEVFFSRVCYHNWDQFGHEDTL